MEYIFISLVVVMVIPDIEIKSKRNTVFIHKRTNSFNGQTSKQTKGKRY